MANLTIDTTTRPDYFTVVTNALSGGMNATEAHVPFSVIFDVRPSAAGDYVEVVYNNGTRSVPLTTTADTSYYKVDTINGVAPANNAALATALLDILSSARKVAYITGSASLAVLVVTNIIDYVVPAGKTFFLTSYCVETSNATGVVDIGKHSGAMGALPGTPGTVDSNYFRRLTLDTIDRQTEDFAPVQLATAGQHVIVQFTPTLLSLSRWSATLHYILK